MECEEEKIKISDVQLFLKDNFQVLALIGVFTAVAKYFVIDDSNKNDAVVFLSILSTLLVIFLLLIFIVDAVKHLIHKTRRKIDQGFFAFLRSIIPDVTIMIIVILVALIALTLIGILILQYPMQLQISLIIIEMIVGLIFAAVFAVFVLLRVRTLQSSFISMLIVWAFLFLVGYGMDLKNNPHFNLFSPSAHLIILVIIIDVLLPITFIKFLYYLYRESQKRMYNGC